MKKFVYFVFICAIAVFIIGCGKKISTGSAKKGTGPVLAKIGDEVVTLGDFEDKLSKLPANIKPAAEQNKAAYLDNLIFESLLYKEGLRKGLDKDREVLEIFEEAKKRIVIARLAQGEVEDKIIISERNLEAYYKEHKDEFMTPELFRASHILISSLEEAVGIVDRLNAGALFEELAKKHSLDVTNKRGGDIGYFQVGQMVPEFEDACVGLKIGEISSPVKTQFGYHIITLTDKKSPEPIEFNKVKERIDLVIRTERRQELFDGLLTRLKSKTDITINSELLEGSEEAPQLPAELPVVE